MKKFTLVFGLASLLAIQLIHAQNSQLFGTTSAGGAHNGGTIFTINADGTGMDSVYSFTAATGDSSVSELTEFTNGVLYGLTMNGGANSSGVLFSFDPSTFTYTDLYNFSSEEGGKTPSGGLLLYNGLFYGSTFLGGAKGYGTIFSFDPVLNKYTDLFDLDSASGKNPNGNMIAGTNGKFYGLAHAGGTNNSGCVFSFDPSSNTFTDESNFNYYNGHRPDGGLMQASNGVMYGLANLGGANTRGTIFSFNPDSNTISDLFNFSMTVAYYPQGGLVQATNGLLYGMTSMGGAGEVGIIFSFNINSNTFKDVWDFYYMWGAYPYGNITQLNDSILSGTTFGGGSADDGCVFTFTTTTAKYSDNLFSGSLGANPAADLTPYNTETTTGIVPLKNNNFSIYPNPSSGLVNITSQNDIDKIQVNNVLGQLIYSATPKQTEFKFELQETGVYFVTVISADQTNTQKVVVSK